MKVLVIGQKALYNKLLPKYSHQLNAELEPVFTEDHAPMTFKLIESEHTQVIYVCATMYYYVKSALNYAIIQKTTNKPNLEIKVLIGDVRQCNKGYINIESFEDTKCFNDKSVEYMVQKGLDDLYYRTRQLINQYHPPIDYLYTAEFTQELNAHDIELATELVPYLKSNVWHPTEDYRNKNGITDKLRVITHEEERYAFRYEVTLLNRIMAWLTLEYYHDKQVPTLNRVVTNGHSFLAIDAHMLAQQKLADNWTTTPLWEEPTEHESFTLTEDYIVPRSECGQLRKVNQLVLIDNNNL